MMKLTDIPLGVLDNLRENHSDEEIALMEPMEVFQAWLEWEGILGYATSIMSVAKWVVAHEILRSRP
jgi:hypothetical protein